MGYTRREAGTIWVSLGVVIFGFLALFWWEGPCRALGCAVEPWWGFLLLILPGLVPLAIGFTYLALSLRKNASSPSVGR